MARTLPFAKIRNAFRRGGVFDLSVDDPSTLHVHFGIYTSYLHIHVEGHHFSDLTGTSFSHADLFPDIESTYPLTTRWRAIRAPGQALFLWDGELLPDATEFHLICADRFTFSPGPHWLSLDQPVTPLHDLRDRFAWGVLPPDALATELEQFLGRGLLAELRTLHDWPEPGRTARLLRILDAAVRGEDHLSG